MNIECTKPKTPFHLADDCNNEEIVDAYLSISQLDINIEDNYYHTPLTIATKEQNISFVEVMPNQHSHHFKQDLIKDPIFDAAEFGSSPCL